MIYGLMHSGSGLGNQLHRYVGTKCAALDHGYEHGMVCPENFKGASFMNLDMGKQIDFPTRVEMPSGKVVVDDYSLWEEKTNYYNPEINFISDYQIADGEFQDERYFEHHRQEIEKWLAVEPITIADDVCVIGFRGGEFAVFPELFLQKDYWEKAIKIMKQVNPDMNFEVHTDDPALAQQFFPDYKVIQDMEVNWRSMRYAKNAIIANSSFFIFPRWLNRGFTIAPRYWARHNIKEWSMPQNFYKDWFYI